MSKRRGPHTKQTNGRKKMPPVEGINVKSDGDVGSAQAQASDHKIEKAPSMDAAAILGHVAWLMAQTTSHRFMFATDLERLVLPPIMVQQFKLYRKERVPLGFVSWAFMSDESEEFYTNHPNRLRPADFTSGENLWIIDLVAPFGGTAQIVKDLRENVFPDRTAKALRLDPKTLQVRVAEYKGVEVAASPADMAEVDEFVRMQSPPR